MKKPRLNGYAYEVMHGARLCEDLLAKAMLSATPALRKKYPDLAMKINEAHQALWNLYQEGGRTCHKEFKK